MRKFLVLGLVLVIAGCADSHSVSSLGTHERLSPNSTVYVSVPTDGRYGNINYAGSGQTTAQTVASAFARHVDRVEVGASVETLEKAQASAQVLNADYIVVPQILHWEDRATEWSGIPDRVEVKVTVRDAQSGRTLASAVVGGKSGLATFGGDHPQDLLAEPLTEYVGTLF